MSAGNDWLGGIQLSGAAPQPSTIVPKRGYEGLSFSLVAQERWSPVTSTEGLSSRSSWEGQKGPTGCWAFFRSALSKAHEYVDSALAQLSGKRGRGTNEVEAPVQGHGSDHKHHGRDGPRRHREGRRVDGPIRLSRRRHRRDQRQRDERQRI